jgi:hypothetical protein
MSNKNCTTGRPLSLSDVLPEVGQRKKKSCTAEKAIAEFAAEGYTVTSEFVSGHTPLRYTCGNGHERQLSYSHFRKGIRCTLCTGRRTTHEAVESVFNAEGFVLLGKYVNATKKIPCVCPNGHELGLSWTHFQKGIRCARCSGRNTPKEEVESAFKTENYVLLTEYKTQQQLLDCICPVGHPYKTTWRCFKKGIRCARCAGKNIERSEVEAEFKSAGYTLTDKREKLTGKIEFLCPNGHNHKIFMYDFRLGRRCGYCAGKHSTHDMVAAEFEGEGYRLLSDFVTTASNVLTECPAGHEWNTTLARFRRGNRCVTCAGQVITHEQVEKAFSDAGYQLLSRYQRTHGKLRFICNNGHDYEMRWSAFNRGARCKICAKTGFDPKAPARLYYVKFFGEFGNLWKIGITNRTIKERFVHEPTPYIVLLDIPFALGKQARRHEKRILAEYKNYLVKDKKLLISGNTECFTKDVLLDDKIFGKGQMKLLFDSLSS